MSNADEFAECTEQVNAELLLQHHHQYSAFKRYVGHIFNSNRAKKDPQMDAAGEGFVMIATEIMGKEEITEILSFSMYENIKA